MEKTKAMVCTLGFIWIQIGEEAYKRRATGEWETFWDRKWTRGSCSECRALVEALSLRHHMEKSHEVTPPQM